VLSPVFEFFEHKGVLTFEGYQAYLFEQPVRTSEAFSFGN